MKRSAQRNLLRISPVHSSCGRKHFVVFMEEKDESHSNRNMITKQSSFSLLNRPVGVIRSDPRHQAKRPGMIRRSRSTRAVPHVGLPTSHSLVLEDKMSTSTGNMESSDTMEPTTLSSSRKESQPSSSNEDESESENDPIDRKPNASRSLYDRRKDRLQVMFHKEENVDMGKSLVGSCRCYHKCSNSCHL